MVIHSNETKTNNTAGKEVQWLLGWDGVVVSKLGWPRKSQLRKAMFQAMKEVGPRRHVEERRVGPVPLTFASLSCLFYCCHISDCSREGS